jgi:hypothetical protein
VVTLADAVKRLNRLTGLSVDEIQGLVSAQPHPPGQMLRVPLYDKKRQFRADLIAALDVVFLERVPDYPAGILARAFRTKNLDELRRFLGEDPDVGPADDVMATEAGEPALSGPESSFGVSSAPNTPARPVGGWPVRLAILVGVLALVLGGGGWVWYHTRPVAVSGVVSCTSGARVTGVWISWFEPLNWGDFSEPPTEGGVPGEWEFAGHTPLLTSWRARVGCGGTAQVWAVKTFSDTFSDNPVRLVCDDEKRAVAGSRVCEVVR